MLHPSTMVLGSLSNYHKKRLVQAQNFSRSEAILQRISSPLSLETILFGPFYMNTQKRWKKPVISAQTRLEDRTRDLRLDKLMSQLKRLKIVLKLEELMSKRRGPYVSMQILSRWRNIVGLNVGMGVFLHKYPHIFDIFVHPVKRNTCCKVTRKMVDLVEEEAQCIKEYEYFAVQQLKKLLMISTTGTLHVHALRLIRRELGLPEDFRDSILSKYQNDFRLVDLETVALVSEDASLGVAKIEKWREKEYVEKWLSEFETRHAFPMHFPTGFKFEKGFREKLKNWQRLPYWKPYEKKEGISVRSCGSMERFEKQAVGILHEFLSLTVDKMVEVERLSHFRRDFGMEINIRELLLKHPGIFYISTKGNTQMVFLRESYSKGELIEPNPIHLVRRKMLDLLLLGCRNRREILSPIEMNKPNNSMKSSNFGGATAPMNGDWVIPMLEGFDIGQNSEKKFIDGNDKLDNDHKNGETSRELYIKG